MVFGCLGVGVLTFGGVCGVGVLGLGLGLAAAVSHALGVWVCGCLGLGGATSYYLRF